MLIYRFICPNSSNNRTYGKWFGPEQSDLRGRHLAEVLGQEAHQAIAGYVETALAGQKVSYEKELHYKDGQTRFVEAIYIPDIGLEGQVNGYYALVSDITARKQAEKELFLLNDLIQLSTQPLSVADVHGHIVRFNHALEQLTGYNRDELRQMTYQQITPEQWHNVEAQYIARLLATGQAVRYEKEYRRKDGELVPVELVVELYRDETGEPKYLYAFPTDITERKQAEAALLAERASLARRVEEQTADLSRANTELTEAMRAKDEFLAAMSHELRTPLNAILGMTEVLQESIYGPLNERQLKSARTIEQSGRHLLNLINDILDIAKVGAGKLELDLQWVSVAEVCQASLLFVKGTAAKKNLYLSFHLKDWGDRVQADPRRLKQILINLLGNAVKFTPTGGR